jgi:hypothetical protein
MAGHTPGEWFLADDGTVRSRVWGESDMMADYKGCVVCDLKAGTGSPNWPATGRKHAQPEAEANARLICAAPDLKAVCEMIVAAQSGDVGDVINAMDAARAVLAKLAE